ncbi:uncharacterized protein LOC102808018 [Saccoglossus kowalevskii]|uniref:Uncharacterized protein LOC102808018 n=1 Tax=Saccoglossus kowalevskii TaxID=10224 RepID=A0ABM0MET2_SACKO|nr:PREDICTED: uncharacterized protein LOC102808018 [Saccoglossus kowalevskii]
MGCISSVKILYALSIFRSVLSDNKTCPEEYPFPGCPRPGIDPIEAIQCCWSYDVGYSCCVPSHSEVGSAILLIVFAVTALTVTVISVMFVCFVCQQFYNLLYNARVAEQEERVSLIDSGIYA